MRKFTNLKECIIILDFFSKVRLNIPSTLTDVLLVNADILLGGRAKLSAGFVYL